MNRVLLSIAALLGALMPLVFDSALKGAALLVVATLCALLLCRASAATRHLVWLVAVIALLAVPVLSVALPQWRVLPRWAVVQAKLAPPGGNWNATDVPNTTRESSPPVVQEIPENPPPNVEPVPPPAISPAPVTPEPPRTWRDWLAPVWAVGFTILALRLLAAHLLLRRAMRGCVVVRAASADSDTGDLAAQFHAACAQLGIRQRVTLLLDARRTIPVVWGVFRPRLLLPAESLEWSGEQVSSVLLHELAHLKRRDPLVQWLTQIACALHWFNPLVWLAAWRLHAERERACDDLVLASGVRPSAYAEHLLHVATKLSPARWTAACGLAMARRSSLEGRLLAVLSEKLNRRGVTSALAAIALLLGAGIAIPVAMLRAADEKKPDVPKTPVAADAKPRHQYAQSLFRKWQARARTDGKIPGGLVGHFARALENFIKQSPDPEEAKKLAALRGRFDTSRDWAPTEAVELLDEVTAIAPAPVNWADVSMEFADWNWVKTGQPLPIELTSAAWGQPDANGLRSAWLLEPRAEQYPLGSILRSRVLFHNAGNAPVVFHTETWHQSVGDRARDQKGGDITLVGKSWMGIDGTAVYRLMPGEYCEVGGHSIAIGAGKYEEEFYTARIAAIIKAKEGDEVSLSHIVNAKEGHKFALPDDPKDPAALWKKQVAERVAEEGPVPASAIDRAQLIRRVMLDIFGVVPTAEEIAAFTADDSPDSLAKLTARLQTKQRVEPWTGRLLTGTTKFRVIAADPNAAKAPRIANTPGIYVLGDQTHLLVRQFTQGGAIAFLSPDPKVASPYKPYEFALPDGIGTYGIVWDRGSGALWVMQKDLVRKYDFTNPPQVQEMKIEPGNILNIPAHLQEAMKKAFNVAGGPEHQQNSQKPNGSAQLAPDIEAQLDWGDAVNGLRGAVVVRSPAPGEPQGVFLAVQNISQAPLRFADTIAAEQLRTMIVSASSRILFSLGSGEPTKIDVTLQPREVVYLPMMLRAKSADEKTPEAALIEGIRKDSLQTWKIMLEIQSAPEGAWKGQLTTAETRGAVGLETPQPKNPQAQALYKVWQSNARLNGDIPGGLVRQLHEKVKEFIRNNEPDASGAPYAKKMAPIEPRFANAGDWKPADVVVLLDDIAAAHTIPLETTMDHLARHKLQRGLPLPASLAKADWGEPLPGGLRMAYVLEPRAKEYRLGTELKARIVLHNSGRDPVAFVTTGFQQPGHTARLAGGIELTLNSTFWTTLGRMEAYRLGPGEYCEIYTPGLGVGTQNRDRDDWSNVRAGSWISCAAGNEVVFTPGAAMLFYDGSGEAKANWWLDFITERLSREAPVPADTKEREYLLYRVVRDLYGAAPSTTEGDAFAADKSPDALKNLAALLAKHPYGAHSHGFIRAGTTTFRVLPLDPDAANRPRVVNNPGWFTLGDDVRFSVTRHAAGDSAVNEASIVYSPKGKDNVIHKVALPDGYETWAAAWAKGTTVMWVTQKGLLRKFDFTNPPKVEETRYEGNKAATAPIPADVREAMRVALDAPDAEKQIQEPRKPAAPAAEKPKGAAAKLEPAGLLGFWRGKINGEDLMISFHRPPVETDVQVDVYFGRATIGTLASFTIAPDGGSVALMMHGANERVPFGTMTPGDAGAFKLELHNRQQGQTEVLLTRDREEIATEPQQKEARELFAMWKITANDDGTIPGTFIGMLAAEVRAYVKANPNLDSAMKLPKLLPRFVTSRDWTAAEAIKLLDDVAYYSTAPIEARVAKAKLPSGALWRSMVPFEDIPVAIAKWSEPKDGLRIGMRVVEGEWRIGGKVRMELWLHNAGGKDVSFQTTGPDRQDAGVALSAVGADGREHWAENGNMSIIAIPLHCTLPAGYVAKAKDVTLSFDAADNEEKAWFAPKFRELAPGKYKLRCQWSDPHPSVSIAGEWTGALSAPELEFTLAAKPAIERATVDVAKDGAISLDREKVTLDELKARAAKSAKKWFTIRADKDVPYAKVIEAVEALKAAGVTEFSFSEARVGDGKYRVANRQDSYKFDDKHGFSICRPSEYPQFFTVSWPAEGERPACWLRTYPNVSTQTQGKWAVVWEPGTNVLWWVDDSDVGKMTLTDPARVVVDREGRMNNFSRDFGLPYGVMTEFRRLGFAVGRIGQTGPDIGGNTGGQSIVSAEFGAWSIEGKVTDADGKPLADLPVRVRTNQEFKTEKTDAKGYYRAYFNLSLQLLANWRAVTVEPVLEGFTERDMAKAGEFNALLRAGEAPQRVRIAGDKDFQPGPIPRFAGNDLVPSQPGIVPSNAGRADFVMLKAGEVIGEVVTADGRPAPPHFIAAATPEQRPGHNAAIELSDAQGHFRLKGIPTNKPVIFTVNPDGKPSETSKSSEQKFEQTGAHKIRIILPAEGSGNAPVKIERLGTGAEEPKPAGRPQ